MQRDETDAAAGPDASLLDRIIGFALANRAVVLIATVIAIAWGVLVAPFDWSIPNVPRDPVPVDAIPDIGENQQIVFTAWPGRSPQDVEDQVSYPLTVALLGMPGVKTVRSYSFFGFSNVYVIFKDDVEFYWSRSRVLEKLASLPGDTLPPGIKPRLGPDATALGQIFWYTLEGRDPDGNPTGGWDLDELRRVQDFYVRYAIQAADGVAEVASVGGFVREYQIDVDPDAMRAANVTLDEIVRAVKMSNAEVGARTIEVNQVEYVIRGLGFLKSVGDLERVAVRSSGDVSLLLRDVAKVTTGPALRRGALDKGGAEVVGGVVVARYGENPLLAIENAKRKIAEISPGLPKKTLEDGTVSQVQIVPFYDRSQLIHETLGTLSTALLEEILVSIIVILVMVRNLRSSLLISSLLPIAVLMCFIAMKIWRVDANVVALSGIAIAIGTMVDMGIIVCENILKRYRAAGPDARTVDVIRRATTEVGSAVITAIATTVISFLPVFTLTAAEGKLFRPLAFTKTFALIASVAIALILIPVVATFVFKTKRETRAGLATLAALIAGIAAAAFGMWKLTALLGVVVLYRSVIAPQLGDGLRRRIPALATLAVAAGCAWILASHWQPLGADRGNVVNFAFVATILAGLLGLFLAFQRIYPAVLGLCLRYKPAFLSIPLLIVLAGALSWLGFDTVFGWLPKRLVESTTGRRLDAAFPGLGREFMPTLDEGSYLYMPSTMPHASIGESLDALQKQDMAFQAIPEIEQVVGKIGRVESPLDPAPLGMVETVLNYRARYFVDADGRRVRFRYAPDEKDWFRNAHGTPQAAPDGAPYVVQGRYLRDDRGALIPDPDGRPFRQWRPALDPALNPGREAWPGIRRPDDIWNEILRAGEVPGSTSAPKLQPISTRLVMLQSGMRAPMGIKVKGPDLRTIERVCLELEAIVKDVPSVRRGAVIADRIVGKPYLEIDIDRDALALYGIPLARAQETIGVAIGGKRVTTTVEGRERYAVRVRYLRELRDSIEDLERIAVPATNGRQIPLEQIATIRYSRGPQVIKSEDTFLVGYVLFDKRDGFAEVDVVEETKRVIDDKIAAGEITIPDGVSLTYAGTYDQQVRASKTLFVALNLALALILIILLFQFRSGTTAALVFSGVAVAWAGGFIMLWLYAQPWFLDFSVFGTSLRDLLQVQPYNLSVAVWVGFLALFGIATDDGVVMATYLDRAFDEKKPTTVDAIRRVTIEAGTRRVRPCLMTTATTVLALLPVLTSTGRGSDIMVPMAIPSFGGMVFVMITMFVVPVSYCAIREAKLAQSLRRNRSVAAESST